MGFIVNPFFFLRRLWLMRWNFLCLFNSVEIDKMKSSPIRLNPIFCIKQGDFPMLRYICCFIGSAAIRALLRDAKQVSTKSRKHRKYVKQGTIHVALKDYSLLKLATGRGKVHTEPF